MEIGTNYIKAISEVSKVSKTSVYKQEDKKVDYSNYSIKEIRDIPYEEGKENIDLIKGRLEELKNNSSTNSDEYTAVLSQLTSFNFSDNDTFNKSIYELKQSMTNPLDTMGFDLNLQINMQDYYYGKDIHASFVKGNGYEELHVNKPLTKSQINSIDFNDFISKMIKTFTEDLNEAPQSVKIQYQKLIDTYKDLDINYNKTVREPYYA